MRPFAATSIRPHNGGHATGNSSENNATKNQQLRIEKFGGHKAPELQIAEGNVVKITSSSA